MVKYRHSSNERADKRLDIGESLKNELASKKRTLAELLDLQKMKDAEIEDLNRRLKVKPRSEYLRVLCPGCGDTHDFRYVPGKYRMCYTKQSAPINKFKFTDKGRSLMFGNSKAVIPYYELIVDSSYNLHMDVSTHTARKLGFWY